MLRLSALLAAALFVGPYLFAQVDYDKELSGQSLQMGTLLTWSTLEETDNRHFLVERSTDGLDFVSIGTVVAQGGSDEPASYSFLDVMAAGPTNYYRLKQIGSAGTQTLSRVTPVRQSYPNDFLITSMSAASTSGPFELTVDVLKGGELSYRLYDFGGGLLEDYQLAATTGLHDLAFDLSAHPEGVYRVQLQMDNERETLYVRRVLEGFGAKPNVATKDTGRGGRN